LEQVHRFETWEVGRIGILSICQITIKIENQDEKEFAQSIEFVSGKLFKRFVGHLECCSFKQWHMAEWITALIFTLPIH
jgi:hypothetical protein